MQTRALCPSVSGADQWGGVQIRSCRTFFSGQLCPGSGIYGFGRSPSRRASSPWTAQQTSLVARVFKSRSCVVTPASLAGQTDALCEVPVQAPPMVQRRAPWVRRERPGSRESVLSTGEHPGSRESALGLEESAHGPERAPWVQRERPGPCAAPCGRSGKMESFFKCKIFVKCYLYASR